MSIGFKYTQKVLTKQSAFWQRRHDTGRYCYPCPGHTKHLAMLRHKPFRMFDRWYELGNRIAGRGSKAYGMYWRLHPDAIRHLRSTTHERKSGHVET